MFARSISVLFLLSIVQYFLLDATAAAKQQLEKQPVIPPVEKLGPNLLLMGSIRIDTAKREISVPGTVNSPMALEFVANTKDGFKAYESALELETNAVTFNTALILIGLDPSNAEPARFHFDPTTPKGDPVDIWVEWQGDNGTTRKVPAEEIVYSEIRKQTLQNAQWVYTGSVFSEEGRYLAERDGVLIGFVHTPATIIENASPDGVGRYGSFVLNPSLGLSVGQSVVLTVRAMARANKK